MELIRRTEALDEFTGPNTALIDGDVIRYQASAVSDGVHYHHPNDPNVQMRYKKDMVAFCEDQGWPYTEEVPGDEGEPMMMGLLVKTITPEPVSFCLHTIKEMIGNILLKTDSSKARVFLTGKGNYRETIATRYPYKGQRSQEKPTHFEAAGEYLKTVWNAETIDGAEADDALGYEHLLNPSTTVICTVDKDLDMIPGKHFNWMKDTLYEVTQADADKFFYTQLLAGDTVDNIKGIPGVGMKKAAKFLAAATEPREMYELCVELYEKAGMTLSDLNENADLLWIQREKDKLWLPPVELDVAVS